METRKRTRASAAKEAAEFHDEPTIVEAPKSTRKKAAEVVTTTRVVKRGRPRQAIIDRPVQTEIPTADDVAHKPIPPGQTAVLAAELKNENQSVEGSSENLDQKPLTHSVNDVNSAPGQLKKGGRRVRGLRGDASSAKDEELMDIQQETIASTRPKRITAKSFKAAQNDQQMSSDEEYAPNTIKNAKGKGKGGRAAQQKTAKVSAPASTKKAPKGRRSAYDADILLSSEKSKLCDIDLGGLINEATWALITESDQQELLQYIPAIDKVYEQMPDGTIKPQLMPGFFRNRAFRDALVDFQSDIGSGRFAPQYLEEAEEASFARMEGKLDKFKDGQFELYWGQRARPGMIAGAAASIKLQELVQKGLLKVGDIWCYRRAFNHADVVIEKELKVIGIGDHGVPHSLTFAMPPGKNKFSSDKVANIIIPNVVSPQAVENAVLDTHPDTPNHVPNGNAFKVLHVRRKNEDLGLLWEIRHTYWDGGH